MGYTLLIATVFAIIYLIFKLWEQATSDKPNFKWGTIIPLLADALGVFIAIFAIGVLVSFLISKISGAF